jgi:hypothetical protein
MKVDELLKVLENIKINEDEINEKREITKYLAQVLDFDDPQHNYYYYYIMTKDKKIYDPDSYKKLLESNKISPNDAYIYIKNVYFVGYDPVYYLCPFLGHRVSTPLVYAYLSKLGYSSYVIVPASGLRFIAIAIRFLDFGHKVVEVTDINTVATNMNLPTLIHDFLITKYFHKVKDIVSQLDSQKLFAGYNFKEAYRIIYRYYKENDTSLAKEVEAIKDAYNHIFKPYWVAYDVDDKRFISHRAVYDPKTKQFIPA